MELLFAHKILELEVNSKTNKIYFFLEISPNYMNHQNLIHCPVEYFKYFIKYFLIDKTYEEFYFRSPKPTMNESIFFNWKWRNLTQIKQKCKKILQLIEREVISLKFFNQQEKEKLRRISSTSFHEFRTQRVLKLLNYCM